MGRIFKSPHTLTVDSTPILGLFLALQRWKEGEASEAPPTEIDLKSVWVPVTPKLTPEFRTI